MIQWPVDKLTLINRALSRTGDNAVSVLEDGSDEYTVCGPAYEDALAVMLEEHGWVQATKVNPALVASPTAPADPLYDTAYVLPADLLHLIWVKLDDFPLPYDILAGQLVLRRRNAGVVSIKYVSTDNSDVQAGTPMFVRALTAYVISAIYSGLHEDTVTGDKWLTVADNLCQRARTRSDQQKPRRQLWRSRVSRARRSRHPMYDYDIASDW